MTTKQKFEVSDPPVIVLANGRYAYRVECPWTGKNGQTLYAFKFCSKVAFDRYAASQTPTQEEMSETLEDTEEPEIP
jgi:hypothetical protein